MTVCKLTSGSPSYDSFPADRSFPGSPVKDRYNPPSCAGTGAKAGAGHPYNNMIVPQRKIDPFHLWPHNDAGPTGKGGTLFEGMNGQRLAGVEVQAVFRDGGKEIHRQLHVTIILVTVDHDVGDNLPQQGVWLVKTAKHLLPDRPKDKINQHSNRRC